MKEQLHYRHIEKSDMQAVVRMENERLKYEEDFGLTGGTTEINSETVDLTPVGNLDYLKFEAVRRWTKTYKELENIVSQYRNKSESIYETRTMVAEFEPGHPIGAFSYELLPDAFEIVFLTFDTSLEENARRDIIRYLSNKTDLHQRRKRIVANVIDGDWELVKLFQAEGWKMKLRKDFFYLGPVGGDDPATYADSYEFEYSSNSETDDDDIEAVGV